MKSEVPREMIHVLVGYDPIKGLSREFSELFEDNSNGCFFAYPDTRIRSGYASSIRPHLMAKHFSKFSYLKREVIFYHDSDILFTRLPDFSRLLYGASWYASDTRSYLDVDYIIRTAGEMVFMEMCSVVGISSKVVIANTGNAGGAQYILKGINAGFWDKMERDCEDMFKILSMDTRVAEKRPGSSDMPAIQSWCTDMWVLWWNALLAGKSFCIDPELDFCWINSPVEHLNRVNILHYTGPVLKSDDTKFRKGNYIHYDPFYDELRNIEEHTPSAFIKKLLLNYRKDCDTRIDLSDVSFLILVRIDSMDRYDNVHTTIRYLTKYFHTTILLLEVDATAKLNPADLPSNVEYQFVMDDSPKLCRTKYNNYLISKSSTPIISIYDTDVIFPVEQIQKAVMLIREKKYSMIHPYGGEFAGIDTLLKAAFMKILDAELFVVNSGKLDVGTKRSFGGAVMIDRKDYIDAGMDNEKITSWGPEDIERVKRMKILGYKTGRIDGFLFHLPHERGLNSSYESYAEYEILMNEYFKICSMRKKELESYIRGWVSECNNNHINTAYVERGKEPDGFLL